MSAPTQAIEDALEVCNAPMPDDERIAFNMVDRPSMFGDDVMDNLQGTLNIARNAKTILRAPKLPKIDAPVIAIGGGPSLNNHLDTIRSLQNKCVIVCAQTSLHGLREAGINPHFCTPMERPPVMAKYLPLDCGSTIFAGAPLVNPGVMDAFNRHCYIPSADCLYQWCNLPGEAQIVFGSSTGTTAVNVSTALSKHKVYLVGHDLCYNADKTHWSGSQAPKPKAGDSELWTDGNNGERVRTEPFWLRLCHQLAETANEQKRLVNTNTDTGAVIPHALLGSLPDASTLPDFTMPTMVPSEDRLHAWKQHARLMPYHARQLDKFFQKAKDITEDETDILKAGIGNNGHAFAYILVSILCQLSYESRMNELSRKQILDWLKTATHNTLRNCMPIFEQISDHAHAA